MSATVDHIAEAAHLRVLVTEARALADKATAETHILAGRLARAEMDLRHERTRALQAEADCITLRSERDELRRRINAATPSLLGVGGVDG